MHLVIIIHLLQQAISIVAGYNFDELIIKTNVFIDEYHDIRDDINDYKFRFLCSDCSRTICYWPFFGDGL